LKPLKMSDLKILSSPYIVIGIIIIAMFALIAVMRMPKNADQNKTINFFPTLKRIFSIPRYREGVVAQFFYVGAQIMCWTFIIHYGTRYFMSQGMGEQEAEVLSQQYNTVAMAIFIVSRFISTFLMRYIRPGRLLMFFAIGGFALVGGVILSPGYRWNVLLSGSVGLHVVDVPYHLWNSLTRAWRGCQVWSGWIDHGDPWGLGDASIAGVTY